MTAFGKPYPPDLITYTHYNALVDALEVRFGPGASGYNKDLIKISNSRGNLWDRAPGNIQLAINDVIGDGGGTVWLPKGKIVESQGWVLDEVNPVHIHGAGMCWHGLDYGTMIEFHVPSGQHCVDIHKPGSTIHFGGLYDLTLYPTSGDMDVIHLDSVSDWHMERIYMNQPKRHGLHVQSTGDCWNLWVKDNLIENALGSGIRLEGGVGAGVILKSYILNNYFYANNIDIEAGALDGTTGKVRLLQLHNNQHFNTVSRGLKFYRKVEQVVIQGHIFYRTGGNAIDIDDDGATNKCERITLLGFNVDGQSVTPTGLKIGGYTSHIVYGPGQIFGCSTAVDTSLNATNVVEGAVIKA